VRPPARREAPDILPSPDAARLGFEEGLRRGLEQGREQGFEAGVRQGHAEGSSAGLSEGRLQAQEELRIALAGMRSEVEREEARMADLAAGLAQAVAGAVAAAEDDLVVLCMEALCRIVGPAVVTPEGVRAQVARLLEGHGPADVVAVHLHPRDAEVLGRLPAAASPPAVRWVADDEVALGGCIVRAATQTVDARLEVVVDAFKTALREGRARHLDGATPSGVAAGASE
jgi:flagellar assembly protein FliH